ncbi:hypothetical protein [Streptomyces sp. NPDC089799]|uniref:hypothetical protein n=1 Tax=Streptomyces sp. NPDC089799 TaxID=3155066 RepID=UPI00343AC74D
MSIVAGIALLVLLYRLGRALQRRRKAIGVLVGTPRGREKAATAVVALGYVPREALDTGERAPVPAEVTAVLDAVRSGDWETGAAWIEAAGTDWDERRRRIGRVGRMAVDDDGWLVAWRTARPEDPTGAAVDADAAVMLAWEVRGSKSARDTTREQFQVFVELLRKAQELVHEAQRVADPADPVPYVLEQPVAMALAYSHRRYEALWAEIVGRAPKLLAAHTGALQYWCAKWCGSHELAESFARRSAAAGAPGDLLSLLPLQAFFEHEISDGGLDRNEYYKRPEVVEAADAALTDAGAADPDDPRTVLLRHMLAWVLYWQDRYPAAVEQFRAVDGYIGAAPWTYTTEPKRQYQELRDYSVRRAAPGP